MKNKRRQAIPQEQRYSLERFQDDFPTDDACLEYIKEKRWPGGVTHCAKCEVERKHYRVRGRTAYACDHCGNHIYPLAGTIFHKSTTSLRKWFYAVFLMGSTRCGISAKQLQRSVEVTYKTAWRMFKQIRQLFDEGLKLEGSSVEMDEMYYGGKQKSKRGRPGRGDKKKIPVVGIVERGKGGRVIAMKAKDASGSTLLGIVRERILDKSTIFTDYWSAYEGINAMPNRDYTHRRINHSEGVYVMGNVHTNTIEGFWSLVKRGIGGVYHSVSEKYLQDYLNEYAFRYNRRDVPRPMFSSILERVIERAS